MGEKKGEERMKENWALFYYELHDYFIKAKHCSGAQQRWREHDWLL